ncbi:MAG: hypothetical protein RIT28_2515 [Pseudomonadota bacterium]|jgi:hypothetical protein
MLCALLLSFLHPAQATEFSVERAALGAADPAYNTIDERDLFAGWGLRAGYTVVPSLTVLGSWSMQRRGASYDAPLVQAEESYSASESATALLGHTAGLGVKWNVLENPWVSPYVSGQGLVQVGTLKLDDDLDRDDNINQISARAIAPGFSVAAGADVGLGLEELPVRPMGHVEIGYGHLAALDYGDLGALHLRGLIVRAGVGVHF